MASFDQKLRTLRLMEILDKFGLDMSRATFYRKKKAALRYLGCYFFEIVMHIFRNRALSPQRQLTLLIHLVKMAQKGAQFVIVTHSPILLAIPDADIFSFDEGSIQQIRYEDTESYQITKMFLDNREYMLKRLLAEDDEE